MRPFPWTALLLLPLTGCSGGSTTSSPTPAATTLSPATTPAAEPPTPPASRSTPPTPLQTPRATATGTPTPLESAPPPGAPTCKAANLTVTDADTEVTPQARQQLYTVRTNGPDCGLAGYPAVTLFGADGKVLKVTYSHGGYGQSPSPAAPLTLSKSTSVSFSVSSPRAGTCVDAATISVVLPGTGGARTAPTTVRICGGVAGVSPVRRLNADS